MNRDSDSKIDNDGVEYVLREQGLVPSLSDMVAQARELGQAIQSKIWFVRNSMRVDVDMLKPDENVQEANDILVRDASAKRAAAYWASPEGIAYAERQEKARLLKEQRQAENERVIQDMRLEADLDLWEEATQGHKPETIRFAKRWGKLMQHRMAEGSRLADVVHPTMDDAVDTGIEATEDLYILRDAVTILSTTWKKGEALRLWYNDWCGASVRHEGVVTPNLQFGKPKR